VIKRYSVDTGGKILSDFLKSIHDIVGNPLPDTFGLHGGFKFYFFLYGSIILLSKVYFLEEAKDSLNWRAEVAAGCGVDDWNVTMS
jgi:hypothetical protein